MDCPLCGATKVRGLLRLNCGNFDGSLLYPVARITVCAHCGHVYNRLTDSEIVNLAQYYTQEYAPINLGAGDAMGDRPGSSNPHTLTRYDRLYDLLAPHIPANQRVLDVGCATGGFLDYLAGHGFNQLQGIDIIEPYIQLAKQRKSYDVRLGDAESMPFPDSSVDVVVMDQVLEHLIHPRRALRETKRVLAPGGWLCVSVPDASRYDKEYFFDFFWFLMREHIQHFDLEHLRLFGAQEGFTVVGQAQHQTPMMSEKMILPVLSVLFRVGGGVADPSPASFQLSQLLKGYVRRSRATTSERAQTIKRLARSRTPLYVWGLGREFLYLYANSLLRRCHIADLVDNNRYKLQHYSVDGRRLVDESVLAVAPQRSTVLITAFAHAGALKQKLIDISYRGQVVEL